MIQKLCSFLLVLFCALALSATDLLNHATVRAEDSVAAIKNIGGKNVLTISGKTKTFPTPRNQYFTAHIRLAQPVDLKGKAISFRVSGSGNFTDNIGIFFRTYTQPTKKSLQAMWSFVGWNFKLSNKSRNFILIPEEDGALRWETDVANMAEGQVARAIRIYLTSKAPNETLNFTISDLKVIDKPAFSAVPGQYTAPKGFMQALGGVKKVGHCFSQLAKQQNPSREGAMAIQYDRAEGKYAGLTFHLKKPVSLEGKAVKVLARGNETASGLYFRFYNKGKKNPVWSLSSWGKPVGKNWTPLLLQKGGSARMPWEADAVGDNSPANQIDRVEVIIGEHANTGKTYDLELADFQVAAMADQITSLPKVVQLMRTMQFGADTVILYPDTADGKKAADIIAAAVPGAEARPGTAADRDLPAKSTIILGNTFDNPAILRLYARRQFPADHAYPGKGKYFVMPVPEAFRVGQSVIGVGASDGKALIAGAKVLAAELSAKNGELAANYFATNREIKPVAANHMALGMKVAQQRLDNGVHTSLGGYLATIGNRYIQNRQSADAKLYAEVCRLYAKSAVPDARKFGGPWGFDSDFLSFDAINGFDAVEHDPVLTDQDRLDMTRCIARWLVEAIVQEAQGGLSGTGAVHNHLTFCSMGTMAGAQYFMKYYPNTEEPKIWDAIAKHNFGRQTRSMKAIDDCNGYQWHVWNHVMTYTNASGDMTFITSGTAEKVMRSMLLTMDNYGLQVPYGDTGSWKCWLSEVPVLQAYHAAARSPLAEYILMRKREWTLPNGLESVKTANNYLGKLPEKIAEPDNFFGVQKLELDAKYYACASTTAGMPFEKCFDKISMRENFDRQGFYILIDGLNNGNHKHADGNSVLRHTQYDRIWLADNDYFKSQQKFHNTLLLNINGESGRMDPYIEYLSHGEDDKFGWYSGRALKLAGKADWTRYIVWLKQEKAYAVLDQVTVNSDAQLLMKQRWNSLGEVTKKTDGAVFEQKGPAMRFQGYSTNRYNYADDYELGQNWVGYPHAEKVVRVLDQIKEMPVKAGKSAMIGGVWHGAENGKVAAWKVTELANGMKIDTGKTAYTITIENGQLILDEAASDGPVQDKAVTDGSAAKLPGKAFRQVWYDQKSSTGNFFFTKYRKDFPFTLQGTKVTSGNKLVVDAPNRREAVVDGDWSGADDSVMLENDQVADWTLTFKKPLTFSSATLCCWWANASSKGTRHQIQKYEIYVDGKKVAARDLSGEEHPNFGRPVEFSSEFKPVTGKSIRFVITPRKGNALYISELLPGGTPPADVRMQNIFEEYTASAKLGNDLLTGTANSVLRCVAPDGKIRWEKDLKHAKIHCITVADLDGDKKPEILCGVAANKVLIMDSEANAIDELVMEHYRVRPEVTIIRVADIDGDKKPEIIVGCDNWRTYAFTADRKFLWHHEVVHPTRAVTVADLNGDGKAEILCGTKYYSMSVLDNKGIRVWRSSFGPGCRTIETPRAADGSVRVAAGSDDGNIYFHTANGRRIGSFNTGDEVRVMTVTGKAKDQKVWAGSFNGYVYQFNADGKLLTYTAIPGEVTAIVTLPDNTVLAGTSAGAVVQINAAGKVVKHAQLGGRVTSLTLLNGRFGVTTQNGETAEFQL